LFSANKALWKILWIVFPHPLLLNRFPSASFTQIQILPVYLIEKTRFIYLEQLQCSLVAQEVVQFDSKNFAQLWCIVAVRFFVRGRRGIALHGLGNGGG
jgi:hypothetical protein